MRSLITLLALTGLTSLSAACLQASAATLSPADGAIQWMVLRYEGEFGVEEIDQLMAESAPHNGGVVSQIDFVLEHSQGWQRTGFDFHQTTSASDADIFVFVSPNHDAVSCGGHGLAAGCAGATEYSGRIVCQITAANEWRDTIVVNHEVGHCLGLGHTNGPGVMTVDFSKMRSWPTEEEVERARQNLAD